jgi:hypothetical protein
LQVYAISVGDVRGYESSDCGGSGDIEFADPPLASKLTPTGSSLATALQVYAISVGDVRGYESSDCGGSGDIEFADPPLASKLTPTGLSFRVTLRYLSTSRELQAALISAPVPTSRLRLFH